MVKGEVSVNESLLTGEADISTACTMLIAIVGFMILYHISKPMNALRWCIWGGCIAGLIICSLFLSDLFAVGMILIIYGIVKVIGYFSDDLYCLAFQYDLACGLFLIAMGMILLDALLKIQISKDARKFGLMNHLLVRETMKIRH